MKLWKVLRAHYFQLDMDVPLDDVKDEIILLYALMVPLSGLVETLRGASYLTMTEAVVTLAKIKKGLLIV